MKIKLIYSISFIFTIITPLAVFAGSPTPKGLPPARPRQNLAELQADAVIKNNSMAEQMRKTTPAQTRPVSALESLKAEEVVLRNKKASLKWDVETSLLRRILGGEVYNGVEWVDSGVKKGTMTFGPEDGIVIKDMRGKPLRSDIRGIRDIVNEAFPETGASNTSPLTSKKRDAIERYKKDLSIEISDSFKKYGGSNTALRNNLSKQVVELKKAQVAPAPATPSRWDEIKGELKGYKEHDKQLIILEERYFERMRKNPDAKEVFDAEMAQSQKDLENAFARGDKAQVAALKQHMDAIKTVYNVMTSK